jgi:PAS domain S-box-containing protein
MHRLSQFEKEALLAQHTRQLVVATDAKGCIDWVNDAFVQYTGYTLEEAKGKKPGHLLQGKATDLQTVQRIRQYLQYKEPFTEEILNYTKAGLPYWIEMHVTPVFASQFNREHIGFVAVETDITRRKEAEQALRRNELALKDALRAAETAAKAKTDFLAMMSHEIRTPLNGVLGTIQLLENSTLNTEQQEMLQALRTSGKSLLKIINNVLDFSKLEANKLVVEEQPLGVKSIIEDVFAMVGVQAREKNNRLAYHLSPDICATLQGDAMLLLQVLTNLVNNANKFTEAGTVQVSVAILQQTAEAQTLEFKVSDTGIGIAPDKIQHLFNDFYQAETGTKRRFEGTGLGLSISKKIVERLGGSMQVQSEEGKGSVFSFTLQLACKTLAEPNDGKINFAAAAIQHTGKPSLRILLAEDNKINQMVANKMFLKMGYKIQIAANGLEVLEQIHKQQYDLVFMDVHMPEMDGLEAARYITQHIETAKRPVIIAMTADAYMENREQCIAAGMSDFLSKPFLWEDIERCLEKWGRPGQEAAS